LKLIWEDPPQVSIGDWDSSQDSNSEGMRVDGDPCSSIFLDLDNKRWLEK